MEATYRPHRVAVLTTRFQYADRHLFLARARLYPDRLELTGWSAHGTHLERIPLDQISHLEWEADASADASATSCLRLDLSTGEQRRLLLQNRPQWEHWLETCLRWQAARAQTTARPAAALSLPELVAYTSSMS